LLSESKNIEELIIPAVINSESVLAPGYSGQDEPPELFIAIIMHLTVFLFPLLFSATVYFSVKNLYEQGFIWSLAVSIPAAWFLADFITGIVHWLCDTYGSTSTPVLGPKFIRDFRWHHKFPKDLTVSPFIYTIGHVALLSALTLPVAIGLLLNFSASFFIAFISLTYAFVTLWTVLTNQFHKWAHADNNPDWVSYLQKKNIILKPDHHQLHHTIPFNSNYCITHGWNNPFLEKIKFFRRAEFVLEKLGMPKSVL
jgi:hypothetical protein